MVLEYEFSFDRMSALTVSYGLRRLVQTFQFWANFRPMGGFLLTDNRNMYTTHYKVDYGVAK